MSSLLTLELRGIILFPPHLTALIWTRFFQYRVRARERSAWIAGRKSASLNLFVCARLGPAKVCITPILRRHVWMSAKCRTRFINVFLRRDVFLRGTMDLIYEISRLGWIAGRLISTSSHVTSCPTLLPEKMNQDCPPLHFSSSTYFFTGVLNLENFLSQDQVLSYSLLAADMTCGKLYLSIALESRHS